MHSRHACREFLPRLSTGLCALAVAGWASLARAEDVRQKRPNILLIYVDDMGWNDLGSYGNTYHETPALDALCAAGMKFTDAYSCGPVCAPSRASMLTGKEIGR